VPDADDPPIGGGPGSAGDPIGQRVGDPTRNVLSLVRSAIQRQDDLREAAERHVRDMSTLRAVYDTKLREAETARIDAIRAVDVGAVNRAAEVSAQAAATLATQVAVSAETLRTQVAAAAAAATTALAAALEPIQKDIADLRRAQYEAQGVKAQTGETRLNLGAVLGAVSVLLVLIFGVISVVLASRHGP